MGCGQSSDATDSNNNAGQKGETKVATNTNQTQKNTQNQHANQTPKNIPNKTDRQHIILKDEPTIEAVDVPKTMPHYPPAKPPNNRKADIYNPSKMKKIDQRARETPIEKAKTFQTLISHLTSGLTSDVEKLRAIFVWMGEQDIDSGDFTNATDGETPIGFMKLMQENRAKYSSFFACLCRAAEIPCVIVEGLAKSVGYKVGDPEEKVSTLYNTWNTVHVGGGWRLVFPLWAFTGVIGFSTGAYTKVESKGKAVREKEQQSLGRNVRHLNEYYFLTDPEEFVYIALPNEPRWQLLQRPWKKEKFVDVPYVRKSYFEEEIDIKSKFSSRLKTIDGQLEVELTARDPTNLKLDYELFYNHQESGKELPTSLQLNNYVFLNRTECTWKFGIRFPDEGVYKLEVHGGRHGYEILVCAFKVFCSEVLEDCQPLPVNPGTIGYGPNLETKKAGLTATSHKDGLVKLSFHKYTSFQFTLTRAIEVNTRLVHNTIPQDELSNCIQQSRKNRNYQVNVRVPQEGEYALQVYSKQKNDTMEQNVCNYLLRTNNLNKKKRIRGWENPVEKNTRANIKAFSKTKGTRDVDQLEKEIERFEKLDMDDKGDLTAAQDALELKKTRKELQEAIDRRHLETLEKAIEHGKSSRFATELHPYIHEAEEVRDHLKNLNKFAHDILEMKQTTISELKSYKKPPSVINDVMFATFLMLGEKSYSMEDWEDLQVLMGKTGKNGLIRRVRQFDTVHVEPDTVNKVKWQVTKHDETSARQASAGCGTFYVWLQNVIGAIESASRNE